MNIRAKRRFSEVAISSVLRYKKVVSKVRVVSTVAANRAAGLGFGPGLYCGGDGFFLWLSSSTSTSAMEERLWMDERMVGDDRRSEDCVLVSFG